MNIGYACLAVGVANTDQKSCIRKNADPETLTRLIAHNLDALGKIIDYNSRNDIRLFRISSDLIPFGSSPVNTLDWSGDFAAEFSEIGKRIRNAGIRVSMHPGQYTVLNSPVDEISKRAAEDLVYHARVLDNLGVDRSNKIILHVGGAYNDKIEALKRFERNYRLLPEPVRNRLVLENDDRIYNIEDLLEIGRKLHVPVVYDNLHNSVNPGGGGKSDAHWISECKSTWSTQDGQQKIHYSQQNPLKKPGSHSPFIRIREFMEYCGGIGRDDIDIMLEVKDKNLSAVKCILCASGRGSMRELEREWAKYKYKVLENAPSDYLAIRRLLSEKNRYPAVEFYELIEHALQTEGTAGNAVNAAQHVWGYFKNDATQKEKLAFNKAVDSFGMGRLPIAAVKRLLLKMALKYEQRYLLDSYYFIL